MTTTEVRSEGTIYIFFVQKMYYTPSHYKKKELNYHFSYKIMCLSPRFVSFSSAKELYYQQQLILRIFTSLYHHLQPNFLKLRRLLQEHSKPLAVFLLYHTALIPTEFQKSALQKLRAQNCVRAFKKSLYPAPHLHLCYSMLVLCRVYFRKLPSSSSSSESGASLSS